MSKAAARRVPISRSPCSASIISGRFDRFVASRELHRGQCAHVDKCTISREHKASRLRLQLLRLRTAPWRTSFKSRQDGPPQGPRCCPFSTFVPMAGGDPTPKIASIRRESRVELRSQFFTGGGEFAASTRTPRCRGDAVRALGQPVDRLGGQPSGAIGFSTRPPHIHLRTFGRSQPKV